jgi:hypothetical protein
LSSASTATLRPQERTAAAIAVARPEPVGPSRTTVSGRSAASTWLSSSRTRRCSSSNNTSSGASSVCNGSATVSSPTRCCETRGLTAHNRSADVIARSLWLSRMQLVTSGWSVASASASVRASSPACVIATYEAIATPCWLEGPWSLSSAAAHAGSEQHAITNARKSSPRRSTPRWRASTAIGSGSASSWIDRVSSSISWRASSTVR